MRALVLVLLLSFNYRAVRGLVVYFVVARIIGSVCRDLSLKARFYGDVYISVLVRRSRAALGVTFIVDIFQLVVD